MKKTLKQNTEKYPDWLKQEIKQFNNIKTKEFNKNNLIIKK